MTSAICELFIYIYIYLWCVNTCMKWYPLFHGTNDHFLRIQWWHFLWYFKKNIMIKLIIVPISRWILSWVYPQKIYPKGINLCSPFGWGVVPHVWQNQRWNMCFAGLFALMKIKNKQTWFDIYRGKNKETWFDIYRK